MIKYLLVAMLLHGLYDTFAEEGPRNPGLCDCDRQLPVVPLAIVQHSCRE